MRFGPARSRLDAHSVRQQTPEERGRSVDADKLVDSVEGITVVNSLLYRLDWVGDHSELSAMLSKGNDGLPNENDIWLVSP